MPPMGHRTIPGGDYRATQHPDGTWVVEDVPVFPEHEIPLLGADGTPSVDAEGNPKTAKIDREWLYRALERSQQRATGWGGQAKPYLPPLHVDHTRDAAGNPQPTRRAGHFALRRVTEINYEGQPRATLTADLYLDPEMYAELRAGKLPYLSPEVHDIRTPELDSIALMDDTVPFFRLPLVTIGEEQRFAGAATPPANRRRQAWALPAGGAVIAYAAQGDHGQALLLQLSGSAPKERYY